MTYSFHDVQRPYHHFYLKSLFLHSFGTVMIQLLYNTERHILSSTRAHIASLWPWWEYWAACTAKNRRLMCLALRWGPDKLVFCSIYAVDETSSNLHEHAHFLDTHCTDCTTPLADNPGRVWWCKYWHWYCLVDTLDPRRHVCHMTARVWPAGLVRLLKSIVECIIWIANQTSQMIDDLSGRDLSHSYKPSDRDVHYCLQ